ncbi:olfactory receptor 12D3-like [Entelurus aequoreus]|uniref:olfactory receptor 12D3-like n=1 Tax=Entelurus aequoreus TaxID=161455 RepID=UPI002B1D8074|nr:olfactory receptor 12D3-like [Entelurus aequoreus]
MTNTSQGLALLLPPTHASNILMLLFNILLATAIIFLNLSVLVAILLNRRLRSENRFMYMLSTCLSDVCTGVSYYYVGVFDINDKLGSPTWTYYIVHTFLGLSYMAILAAQADRYHAVVSPLKYSQRMSLNRTLLVICTYWLYAFFIVAVHNIVTKGTARQVTSLGTLVGNIFTIVIMIGLNIRLFIIARVQQRREQGIRERDGKRASVNLILVVAAFYLGTWMPIFCHVLICSFSTIRCFTFRNEGTDPIRILPRVNAALTPVLYIKGCTPLKDTLFTRVWRPCCSRRR